MSCPTATPDSVPYNADAVFGEVEEKKAEVPAEPARAVQLRHYQKAAIGGDSQFPGVFGCFRNGARSCLVVMATGTGKTPTMSEICSRADGWGHGTLFLSHRERLIRQIDASLARVGIYGLIEQAEYDALPNFGLLSKTVIASVATMRGDRLQRWPRNSFRLIVSDEAHHSISPGWMAILEHFGALPGMKGARHVGFTATADRLDGKNVGRIFEELAYEYNLRRAISEKFLAPVETMVLGTLDPPIDLRDLRVSAGADFTNEALEEAIQGNIGRLVNALVNENALGDRATIAFTPDVKSAEALALALQDVGVSAEAVSYRSSNPNEIIRRFEARQFQVLCNAMLLTEGADFPFVSCVLILRPTKSRSLYSQMVGRGTRLCEIGKVCRVIDLPYLYEKHDLVGVVDLYDDGGTDDRLLEFARKVVEKKREEGKKPVSLEDAMEEAQREFDLSERVRIQRRDVQVRSFTFDPLGAMEILGMAQKQIYSDWSSVQPASEKQKAMLARAGVTGTENMGKAEASRLIGTLFKRREVGLATIKQVNFLVRLGVEPREARKMSMARAGEVISELKSQKQAAAA